MLGTPKVSFSGISDRTTAAFTLNSPLRIEYSASGTGSFIVKLVDPSGSLVAGVANLIGKATGTAWIYGASGTAYFHVTSDGPWTISADSELVAVATLPLTFQGTTNQITAPFLITSGASVTWSHAGTGEFIVDLIGAYDGSTTDTVANFFGKGADQAVVRHGGVFAFDVIADGAWSLAVTPGT